RGRAARLLRLAALGGPGRGPATVRHRGGAAGRRRRRVGVAGARRLAGGVRRPPADRRRRGRRRQRPPRAGRRGGRGPRAGGRGWGPLARARTDGDGRVRAWPGAPEPAPGVHRLTFATGAYFGAAGVEAFHPEVSVVFRVADAAAHHHVPLLLSPFGYTTYRGT